MLTASSVAFPDHNIDPRKKDEAWMLQMAKAVWGNRVLDMPSGGIFYTKAAKYEEIRSYAMARQSISKYKKNLTAEDSAELGDWTKISWDVRADGMVIRNIAVAKLQKAGYNIIATPVNPDAKDAQDEEFAKAKIKILYREQMLKQDPEMANSPLLKKQPGEADDLEELQMQIDFSPKFVRAKDTEEAVQLVFTENDATQVFDTMSEDIVDFGVGIVKEWLNENNKVCFEHVYPGDFICSYSRKGDFSDIMYGAKVRSVKLSDLVKYFGVEKMVEMAGTLFGKDGNPTSFNENTIDNNGLDIFKAQVLDLEFISWDTRATEENKDNSGNLRISKTDPKNLTKVKQGKMYVGKTVEVVYKCKWVIGTDMMYDWGKATNQKRTVEVATMTKTSLSFHVRAGSFHKMKAVGMTENMISAIDDLCETSYKLRNFKNRMVPNGFDIDLSAIENVALGGSGDPMKPSEVIDMFFETGVLVSRRSGISMDENVNYKAINAIQNGMADQLIALAQELQNNKQTLRDISGLNEMTDASTPNPKTLVGVATFANEATNNALYFLVNARRKLIEATARGVVQRLQIAIKNGPYDGYSKEAGRWVNVSKSILDFDYDIILEDLPSDEQKQALMNLVQEDIKNGFLDTSDVIHIINIQNIKHAQMLLAYRVKKNKQAMEDNKLAGSKQQNDLAMQTNQAAEALKLENDKQRHQMKMEEIIEGKAWDLLIMKERVGGVNQAAETKAITEITKVGIQAMTPPDGLQPPVQSPEEEGAEQPAATQ